VQNSALAANGSLVIRPSAYGCRLVRPGGLAHPRLSLTSVVFFCLGLAFMTQPAAGQDNTWQGAANVIDFFSNAGAWSLGVPDGSTNITIPQGGVLGDTSFTNSQTLTIGAPAELVLLSGTTVANTGSVVDNGTLNINSGATLSNNLGTFGGTGTFLNSGTIEGAGQIGSNSLGFPTLVNQAAGTINANVSGQTLTITGVFTSNAGLMEATGGGMLFFTNGIIANQAGTIAANGGQILLASSTITGGTITALNGGSVSLGAILLQGGTLNNASGTILGGGGALDGSTGAGALTIQGTYTADVGTTTTVLGTINNQGNIQVNAGGILGADAHLTLGANTTLQGGGTVTLAGLGIAGTAFVDGTRVLTNVDNTIQGAGQIGDSTFGFPLLINEAGGTINANVSGQTLRIDGVFVSNAGLMEATLGGTLDFANGIIANQGGTIAANGGTMMLEGSTVTGGTITALNGGTIQMGAGATIQGGTLNNASGSILGLNGTTLDGSTGAGAVTIQGTYTVSSLGVGVDVANVLGTINNQGNIQVNAGAILGADAHLTLGADTTLQGGGTVTLVTPFNSPATAFIDGTHVLTNVDNTIQGAGQIGSTAFGFPTLVNGAAGTINANVSGQQLTIEGVLTTNAGLMEATGGGLLVLEGSPLTNAGTVQVDAGSTISVLLAPFTQTGGKTQVDGTLLAVFGENVSGGMVLGTGTINGNITMTGGAMQPGGASTPGALVINGNYDSTAAFNELINASGNGLLVVNGSSTLESGALLNIELLGGFTPFVGETFTLVDFLSGTGTFANAPTTGFVMDGFNWSIAYNATDIVLDAGSPVSTTPTPEPGSMFLLGTGLAALAGSIYKKRQAQGGKSD
jgi:hypothetical protein